MTDSIETPILPVTDEPKTKFWTRPLSFIKKNALPIAAVATAATAVVATVCYRGKRSSAVIDGADETTLILPRLDEEVEADA